MLLAIVLIKKKQKQRKREAWVKGTYKNRETFGSDRLANEMQQTSREAYSKKVLILFLFCNSISLNHCC